MDTTNIQKQYFLERHWGVNCQPGHRKGKNKRRSGNKQRIRQAKRQLEIYSDEFCSKEFPDHKIQVSSNDEKLVSENKNHIQVSSNDEKLVSENKNHIQFSSNDILSNILNFFSN